MNTFLPADLPDQGSPANSFPQAVFAPYNDPGFAWNPAGTGLAMDAFDFPILLLDNVTAPAAAGQAADNAQRVSSLFCSPACHSRTAGLVVSV